MKEMFTEAHSIQLSTLTMLFLNKAKTALLVTGLLFFMTHAISQSLIFDGVDDYITTNYPGISGQNARTVEFWIKTTQSTTGVLVSWGTESFLARFAIYVNGGKIFCAFSSSNFTSPTSVNNGAWHHVAYTYASGTHRVYIDGTLDFTSVTGMNTTLGNNMRIGEIFSGGTRFSGSMDELRVWNVERTASEISSNKNSQLSGSLPSSLVAYYKFNCGTANATNTGVTTATDATTNAYNGTLNNFALSGTASNWVCGATALGSCAVVSLPEIDMKGNAASIASGTTMTSMSNHTDFGSVLNGGSFARTFTIDNTTGTDDLTISNIVSSNTKFVIGSFPTLVSTGNTGTFTVTFNPTATGAQTATITVTNNDCDEGTYTFAVTGLGSAPLSVELLNFTATPSVSSVKLAWETANEVNNKGFQIEQLMGNGQWTTLGFVSAKSKASSYEFVDNAPLSINYYRLRQIDNDGTETLSKVVAASLKGKNVLKAYPSVSTGLLTLETSETGDYQIFNLLGKQVLYGKTMQQIDVSALPQGTYMIKAGTEQVKFVKQ
jgi:hypothetical protein